MPENKNAEQFAQEAIARANNPLNAKEAISIIVPEPSEFGKLLCKRQSDRVFSENLPTQQQIERILVDCAGGVRSELVPSLNTSTLEDIKEVEYLYRTIPQSGAINATHVHLILLKNIATLTQGIYTLCPFSNSLHFVVALPEMERLREGMGMTTLEPFKNVTAILVISTNFETKSFKYDERGYRYSLLEAGCALQNALLSMSDQNVKGYPYGGFNDQIVSEICRLDFPTHAALITILIGSISMKE